MRRAAVAILAAIIMPNFLIVNANPIYEISLLGGRWHEPKIGVRVPDEPRRARELIEKAMASWNRAQAWFQATYGKSRTQPYELEESADGSVGIELVDFTGVTHISEAKPLKSGTAFLNATVVLPLSLRGYPVAPEWFETVALHEFGHVLGIDHTNVTGGPMSISPIIGALRSTLDLFAVYTLAQGKTPSQIALDSSIPYAEVPVTTIPEFPLKPDHIIALILLVCSLVLYSWRTRQVGNGALAKSDFTRKSWVDPL